MRAPVVAIRGDPDQTATKEQINVDHLDSVLESIHSAKPDSDLLAENTVTILNQATLDCNTEVGTHRDRLLFHQRALATALSDQERLKRWAADIEIRAGNEKAKYNEELEGLRFAWSEVQNGVRSKIQIALQQLKSLREFQDHKHRIDQQKRQVSLLIKNERAQNSDDLTEIHHQLLDQRMFYENDFSERMATAQRFVADFSDLHMDLLAQRIADETMKCRGELDRDNEEALKNLNENSELRRKWERLEQQHQIHQMRTDRSQREHTKAKEQTEILERALTEQLARSERVLTEVRETNENRVAELRRRLRAARDRNVELKQEAAVAARNLAAVEEAKYEHFRREYELMQSMNDAAVFLLTALDDRFGPIPEENAVRNQRCTLNQIIRKLATIKVEKPKEFKNVEVQTNESGLTPTEPVAPKRRATGKKDTEMTIVDRVLATVAAPAVRRPRMGRIFVKTSPR
jgi:hypothetical protein